MSAQPLNPKINRQWHADRPKAVERLSQSIVKHGGNLTAVSRELEVSLSTLVRWTERDLMLAKALKEARASAILGGSE